MVPHQPASSGPPVSDPNHNREMTHQRLPDTDNEDGRRRRRRRTGVVLALAAAALCAAAVVVALHRRSGPPPPRSRSRLGGGTTARPIPGGGAGSDRHGDDDLRSERRLSRYDYSCWDKRSRKKCKQAVVCQWDATAGLCTHRLPGTFDPEDAPGHCQGKNQKQCRKAPGCKPWPPDLRICIDVPGAGTDEDDGGDDEPIVPMIGVPCLGRMKKLCKDDATCEWSRKENRCKDGEMPASEGSEGGVNLNKRAKKAYVRIASSNVADVVPVARQGT